MGKSDDLFCYDTLVLRQQIRLNRRKDDELSILFPGDELNYLNQKEMNDTCYVSQSFLSLLGVKNSFVYVYQLAKPNGDLMTCKLFEIEKNKQMIFYSENNFLLFEVSPSLSNSSPKE